MIDAELTKGTQLLQNKQLYEACDFFEQLVKRFPKDPRPASNLGVAYLQVGEKARAIEMFKQAVQLSPKSADLWFNLAVCLAEVGQIEKALGAARESLVWNPQFQRAKELIQRLEQTSLKPVQPPSQNKEKVIYDLYMKAVQLYQQRRMHDAKNLILRLLEVEPEDKNALNVLGAIHFENQEYEAAQKLMKRLSEQHPNDPNIWCNLGKSYSKLTQHTAANEALRKALALDSENDEARRELAFSLVYSGLGKEAMKEYEFLVAKNPNDFVSHSNLVYLLTWLGIFPQEELTERHRVLGRQMTQNAQKNPLPPSARKLGKVFDPATGTQNRKIRLGYISPDFRYHSVHLFFSGIVEHHDQSKFELFFYSNTKRHDAATELYKSKGVFRDIVLLSDRDAALMIQNDELDLLIDLAGHTSKTRLPVLAYKPAPIQLSYLGYPNTTGMEEVDYFITDQFCDPQGVHDEHFVETLIRLETCKYAYRPKATFPEVSPLPCLAGNPFTFGCFNNPSKYNEQVFKLWADLLNAVPDSRLLLKAKWFLEPAMNEAIQERFKSVGGDTTRLVLHDYTESCDDIDIALDPFPFNGATTTCQALWMGLPVLTTIGTTHICRRSYSILNAVGLNDFCATSDQDFIEKARYWKAHPEQLAEIRLGLRKRFTASPLRDELGLTRSIESALTHALRNSG